MFYPSLSGTLAHGYNNGLLMSVYFLCRFFIFQSSYGTFVLSVNRLVSIIFPYKDYHNNKKFLIIFLPFYILLPLSFTWFLIPSAILLVPVGKYFSDDHKMFIIGNKKPEFYKGPSVSKSLYLYLLIMGTIQLLLNIITSLKLVYIKFNKKSNASTTNNKQEHKLIIFTLITYLFQICFIIQNNLIMLYINDEDETISTYLVGIGIKLVTLQMFGTLCGLIVMSKVLRDKLFNFVAVKKSTVSTINIRSHSK
ncbi:7TM GPCR, serpentine receptor class g (Srg) family-containing protein [Strongyloides ratti]|uniref:7TM GPCR, serpentine receptor class g (Srg) family-containing protein n=1 Tax=Strongyloides ratti TaxID=34506 RepID=A0A090MWQ8_STRRB|nr:7TM GPCR, serpentine receptor class g (Srg) family-containing protein [Strongyloides ratti]CEF64109.1 7TM GPCR, serpentine receptor class g (Srg) family-containing protein [Strongyloides ratti]